MQTSAILKQKAKKIMLLPERLCGMDGQWPFFWQEKPKQTAQWNWFDYVKIPNLFLTKQKKKRKKNAI